MRRGRPRWRARSATNVVDELEGLYNQGYENVVFVDDNFTLKRSRVREICDRYGIVWIADEVMSGFGRCGEWFAWQRYGAEAVSQIITFGKLHRWLGVEFLANAAPLVYAKLKEPKE